jgi:hypothetical protein
MSEKLYFDSIKERYDTFFVEYKPPMPGFLFATLNIIYPENMNIEEVAIQLEKQAKKWAEKYPVPVMASAFDKFGDLINLDNAKGSSHLTVFERDGKYEKHWRILEDNEIPPNALDSKFLLAVYTGIGCRTQSDVTASAYENIRPMRRFKLLLIVWAVFIPALIATLEFLSPTWVAAIALVYSLWKAYQQWLLMTGRKEKTKEEIAKEKEELRMRHYHYHCEQNPDAFAQMKIENFKREAEARVKNEFNSLPSETT